MSLSRSQIRKLIAEELITGEKRESEIKEFSKKELLNPLLIKRPE